MDPIMKNIKNYIQYMRHKILELSNYLDSSITLQRLIWIIQHPTASANYFGKYISYEPCPSSYIDELLPTLLLLLEMVLVGPFWIMHSPPTMFFQCCHCSFKVDFRIRNKQNMLVLGDMNNMLEENKLLVFVKRSELSELVIVVMEGQVVVSQQWSFL